MIFTELKSISLFDNEIAIKWSDGSGSFISLKSLRLSCPCAWCSGEKDVLGNLYKGQKTKFSSSSFDLSRFEKVGLYGVRFFWGDNHHDGIYTFDLLRCLSNVE